MNKPYKVIPLYTQITDDSPQPEVVAVTLEERLNEAFEEGYSFFHTVPGRDNSYIVLCDHQAVAEEMWPVVHDEEFPEPCDEC